MCWCMKVACPLFVNLASRISEEIADLVTTTFAKHTKHCDKLDRDLHTVESVEAVVSAQPMPFEGEQKPFDTLHRWNESLKNSVLMKRDPFRVAGMAERPLPVPVENECYYKDIGREEAEVLLKGQPDGTFILRPSSQSNHAYTVTLTYQYRVYNIGCRKRHDGRLALGFSKVAEPNFLAIDELIDYYRNEKLVLLVDGKMVGSTVLRRLTKTC